jgi:hypothetical protein
MAYFGIFDLYHVDCNSDDYHERSQEMDSVVLEIRETNFEIEINRNEELENGYHQPRGDHVRWPK